MFTIFYDTTAQFLTATGEFVDIEPKNVKKRFPSRKRAKDFLRWYIQDRNRLHEVDPSKPHYVWRQFHVVKRLSELLGVE